MRAIRLVNNLHSSVVIGSRFHADARQQPRKRARFRRIAGVFVPSVGACFGIRRDGDATAQRTAFADKIKVVGRQSATLKFVLEL